MYWYKPGEETNLHLEGCKGVVYANMKIMIIEKIRDFFCFLDILK